MTIYLVFIAIVWRMLLIIVRYVIHCSAVAWCQVITVGCSVVDNVLVTGGCCTWMQHAVRTGSVNCKFTAVSIFDWELVGHYHYIMCFSQSLASKTLGANSLRVFISQVFFC